MKKITSCIALILLMGCSSSQKKNESQATKTTVVEIPEQLIGKDLEGNDILLGAISLVQLENFTGSWLNSEKAYYKTDPEKIKKLQPLLVDKKIKLYMGTWCEDSQREVPGMIKILEESNYPVGDIEIVALDENKFTPEGLEKKHNVFYVPTLIFFDKEGEEMNRIVEFPIERLELDMLKILKGEPYKNAYAE